VDTKNPSRKEILLRSEDTVKCGVGFKTAVGLSWNNHRAAVSPLIMPSNVSVGIIVRNEDRNIVNLLRSVSKQKLKDIVIDEIIVVSSGSEDRTNGLVLKYAEKDDRVNLIIQTGVEGKAPAINEFLNMSRNDSIIVSSGDVIFHERALQNLVSPLIRDERVGLTSAEPIPINDSHSFMGAVANMHWRLHRLLERHGETIAFRKSLVGHIPDEVSADEAYVEAIVRRKAFRAVQASDSFVFNKGSESIFEFLDQVRRQYAGHLFIKASLSYVVSSMTTKGLVKVARELLKYVRESPDKIGYVIGYVNLEALGRLLGIWDFYVKGRTYRVWHAAQTTKNLNSRDTARFEE
jgi:glycosyltransferase involved in cell wall biosynthesis